MTQSFKCQHCGSIAEHQGRCPLVKAIEYFENGMVKRVEYMTPVDYMSHVSTIPLPHNPANPVAPQSAFTTVTSWSPKYTPRPEANVTLYDWAPPFTPRPNRR